MTALQTLITLQNELAGTFSCIFMFLLLSFPSFSLVIMAEVGTQEDETYLT